MIFHQLLSVFTVINIVWLCLYFILVKITEACGQYSVRGTCHSHDCGSYHPWRIIFLFDLTSTPCQWKMTVHPASQSLLTVSRLCCRFLSRNAICAVGGIFANWRHVVFSVYMSPPFGIVSWCLVTSASTPCCTNEINAAESIKAVMHIFFLGWHKQGCFLWC